MAFVVKVHFTIYVLTNFIENAIKSDRAFYQHRVSTITKTGLGVQVPVHDYKHSKGTLLVTKKRPPMKKRICATAKM